MWNNEEDRWRWKLEDNESFSVKSLYHKLEGRGLGEVVRPEGERRVFRHIWKVAAPSKVRAFVWKSLLDRIPTRINLEKRNCLPPGVGSNCVRCVAVAESSSHLFLHCDLAWNIWLSLMSWLDLHFVMPPNLFIHRECWSGGSLKKKVCNGLRMIWEAVIWVIWKARNECIFNNVIAGWVELVGEVKVLSWRWLLGRSNCAPCLFYEWIWCPRECLSR